VEDLPVEEVGNKQGAGAQGLCSRQESYTTEREIFPNIEARWAKNGVEASMWCLNQDGHCVEAGLV